MSEILSYSLSNNEGEGFREESRRNWEKNSYYWLHNPLRQVQDTKVFFEDRLKNLIKPEMRVIDMGCGSGWLLEFIQELKLAFSYVGLDFNGNFIEHLKKKHSQRGRVLFEKFDVEESLPDSLLNCADIVFNCFNFFEVINLSSAFANSVKMLKRGGKLVIFTIDPIYLIFAISHSLEDFKINLKSYEDIKSRKDVPYFFQSIDLGDSESDDLKYPSVLYSLDDFYRQASRHGLSIVDYAEIVKTSKFIPKVYQYVVFQVAG